MTLAGFCGRIREAVTIDGPAGAGKSTVARMLAGRLGYLYIDTGAMYRAVTLQALNKGVDLRDEAALAGLAAAMKMEMTTKAGEGARIFLDGKEVTQEIRTPRVTKNVSLVALVPGVRREMTRRQREMAALGGVVVEGRDAGTVILPEARFKYFLTASEEERARRRQADLEASGVKVQLSVLREEIKARDELDSSRAVAPLKPAPGAQIIDCSRLCAEEVVELILKQVGGKKN